MNSTHPGVALVVGIDYVNGTANRLEGAVNDARAFADLLVRRFGFARERVRCLLEDEATRDGIEAGFTEHLAKRACAGQPAVFFFAGHGTRVHEPHLNGEPDLYDEALVPVDRRPRDGRSPDILDDTLRHWLDAVRATGASTLVVLDCCHAGTATRDDGPTSRAMDPFDGPPPERLPPFEAAPDARPGSLVVLSASADRQTAQECRLASEDGPSHGVFTRCLIEILDRDDSRPTWREIHDRLLPAVRTINPSQTPQIEGDGVDRVVFADEERPLTGHHRLSRAGEVWRLGAGRLHGLKAADILEVVPLGQTAPTGRIRVVELAPCSSTVAVVDGDVPSPARAHLSAESAPFDVRLHVPAALEGRIGRSLDACAFVVRVEPDVADLRLAVVDGGLTLQSPEIASPAPFAPDALPSALRRWSTWFGLRRLQGGMIDVDVRICRRDEHRPRDDTRPVVLSEGEIFIVKATNRSTMNFHLGVLELSDDGAIAVRDWAGSTAPGWRARADQLIAPGRTVFLAGRATVPPGRSRDRCTFVAIATIDAIRYHALSSDADRDGGDDASGDLLDRMGRRRSKAKSPWAEAIRWGVGRAVYETHREAP